jgi:hypothetical protein
MEERSAVDRHGWKNQQSKEREAESNQSSEELMRML